MNNQCSRNLHDQSIQRHWNRKTSPRDRDRNCDRGKMEIDERSIEISIARLNRRHPGRGCV